MNFTAISYANYKNANLEHRATFKSVTSIPTSAIDTLRSLWVIDSDTTNHMNADRDNFKVYKTFNQAKPIYTGRRTIYAHGFGEVKILARQVSGLLRTIRLHNILHVPSLITNLISISALREKGAY